MLGKSFDNEIVNFLPDSDSSCSSLTKSVVTTQKKQMKDLEENAKKEFGMSLMSLYSYSFFFRKYLRVQNSN